MSARHQLLKMQRIMLRQLKADVHRLEGARSADYLLNFTGIIEPIETNFEPTKKFQVSESYWRRSVSRRSCLVPTFIPLPRVKEPICE